MKRLCLHGGSRFWIGAVASLTLAQVVVSALLPRGFTLTAVSDSLSVLLLLALLVAFSLNAIPAGGRLRGFWIMQSVGWAISLVSQCWWMYYDLVLLKPIPMLFAGDVLVPLPGILMLAGFLLRPHLQQSKRNARLGMLDFLLLILWWVCFYATLVMCWQYASPNEALYNRNYDRLYMAEILALVAVLSFFLRQSAGAWRRFYGVFLGVVLFNYCEFVVENRAVESHTYFSGSWYDSPNMAAFALFMVVAMMGRGLEQERHITENERYSSWMAALAILAVLSLPVILVSAELESNLSMSIVHFRVLVTGVAMFALASLVFMKQQLLHAELKKANEVLEESSTTDPLTGIRNRRFFSSIVEGDVSQTLRAYAEGQDKSARDLIFYLVDFDSFKKVNDAHGHDAGDRVLIEASRRINSVIRNSDILVRWGGEEFLIVSRATDRRQAGILARRVIDVIGGTPYEVGASTQVQQTCSIGWAAFPWLEGNVNSMGYEEVIKFADRGLYRAKKAGKNRAVGMTPLREDAGPAESGELNMATSESINSQPMQRPDLQLAGRPT